MKQMRHPQTDSLGRGRRARCYTDTPRSGLDWIAARLDFSNALGDRVPPVAAPYQFYVRDYIDETSS